MAGNPSKGVKRQQYQSSEQDILNQSYDPVFATLVNQVVGSPDGTNLYSLKVNADGSINTAGGGTPSATINIGQTTSAVTATQLSSSSIAMTNGIVIQALSTNTASVYIGNSSVTTANGFELTAGSSLTISPSNINLVYVIGSNATDKVCWSVT